MPSVFSKYKPQVYRNQFQGKLFVGTLVGGTPDNQKVAEGWLRSKFTEMRDEDLARLVADVMLERGVSPTDGNIDSEIIEAAVKAETHNGFKRDETTGELYLEGRCLKANLKEAANILWSKERWGPTKKGTKSFFAEHLFVHEERLMLGVKEPAGMLQQFIHTFRGSSIQYNEYVSNVEIDFTVMSDFDFKEDEWGQLWTVAEQNGVGSCRSQGYGVYDVVEWAKIDLR